MQHAFGASDGGPLQDYLRENEGSQNASKGDGLNLFRTECLRPVKDSVQYQEQFPKLPFYERHGERQRAAGFYERVIRYREHLVPIAEALRSYARGGG